MTLVVSCLGVAVDGTIGRIVALSLTEWMVFVTQVGILALGIQRSIDCTTECNRSGIASNCWRRRCFIIRIGASDRNSEAIPPLSLVCSLRCRHRCTPQRTLVIGETWWVRAGGHIRIQTRVAFDVHVECLAARGLVTKGGASESIKALQCLQAHIIRGAQRSTTVLQDYRVAVGGGGIVS